MIEKTKRIIKDKDLKEAFDDITNVAVGINVITSAPTNAQMKVGVLVKQGTDLYLKFPDGTTLKFSGTSVS